jgi:hypothetical protein
MNKQDENKLVMMKALLSFLKLNRAIWEGSAPFAAAVEELEILILGIESLRQSTDVDQSGQVAEKRTLKVNLVNKNFEIVSQIFAMACKTKNQVLQARIGFSKSELEGQRDGELVSTTNMVLELASSILEDLVTYDVTAAELEVLGEIKERYENSLSVPRLSVTDRKANNAKLKELMGNSKTLLNDQLKRLMVRYQSTNPDFYNRYLATSKVVDYGLRHDKPENPDGPATVAEPIKQLSWQS